MRALSSQVLGERVSAFLRGRHPLKTACCVEAETGVPAATVRKWLQHGCAPSGTAYDALIQHYGPAFLCAVHPDQRDGWFVSADRQEELARLVAEADAIHRKIEALLGGAKLTGGLPTKERP